MFDYIKRKFRKYKQKRKFASYGSVIKKFSLDGIGSVEYAQWQHPFEQPKEITDSNVNFYKKLAKAGSFAIDIGAHTGDTTVPMALAVGSSGLVLALEPNKYVFQILVKNASLNPGHTNIKAECFAATKEEGEFVFNYSDASFNNGGFLSEIHKKTHNHDFKLAVQGKNLEQYLLKHYSNELSKLELIKVDAEGYDKEILKSIPHILKSHKPNLMVECYKRLDESERNELFDTITNFGYNLYHLESFDESGAKTLLKREDMNDRKHFEMLAIHKDKTS